MPEFDLASVLSGAQRGMAAAGELRDAALQTNVGVTEITNGLVADAKATAEAAATIKEQELNVARQQELTRLKIANRMGTNANDSGWLAGKLADRVKQADTAMTAGLATIQAKQSVSFFDNPLGYLYAQSTVDGDIGEYNGWSRQKDLAVKTASELESMTAQSYQNNNALVQTSTDATIAASKILAAHQFNREAGEAALNGLRTNLQGMQVASNATMDQVRLQFSGSEAVMREKQYSLSLAHLQIAQKSASLAEEAKKNKLEEGDFIERLAKQGYFTLSGNEMPDSYKRDLQKMYAAKVPQVVAWVESGLAGYMADPSGSKPVISHSPFDVTAMTGSGMVRPANDSQKQVLDQLMTWRKEFDSPAVQTQQKLDPKDKTATERAFNSFVATKSAEAQSNVSGTSIYTIPSLSSVAAANKNVAALPVWQTVLAPLAAAGAKLDDPTFVVGSVISAVKEGKLSYKDALQTADVYAAGVMLNNQSRNFIAMGMTPATQYAAPVQAPGEFGKSVINLSDQKKFAVYLNKELSRAAILGRGIPGVPAADTPINRMLGRTGQ
jgi:hypothetical protein